MAAGGDATALIEGALALAVEPDPLAGVFPWRGEPDRVLPVDAQLRGLLPEGGLRRGMSVSVSGATSLLIGMLAEASRAGSWCAIVGLPTLGMVAAAESGMALARTALVPHPGLEWTGIVAALLDGFDIVVVVPSGSIAAPAARRLAARARQRGSVLMTYGAFPGADLCVRATRSQWLGLERGCGRLRRRELTVVANGRGSATRPRTVRATMPDAQAMNEGWAPRVDWVDRDIDSGAERPDLALVSTVE